MSTSRIVYILLVLNIAVALGGVFINYSMIKSLKTDTRQLASTTAPVSANSDDAKEYNFFPVEKVIVSLQDEGREHYFVIDLVLQSDKDINLKKLEKIDPIVRSSAVAYLSRLTFSELRTMPVIELQAALEKSLFEDFASKNIVTPFAHVLVSKLIVQ